MLSEESRRIRNRSTAISIHITFTTWLLELIGNIFIIVCMKASTDSLMQFIIFKIYWFHSIILIPSLYICNTEKVKDYLKTIGWYNNLIEKLRPLKIHPVQTNDINLHSIPTNRLNQCSNKAEITSMTQVNSYRLLKSNSESQILYKVKNVTRKKSL